MDEKMLEEILKQYQEELSELKKNREKNAERHSQMTEEELIDEGFTKEESKMQREMMEFELFY